MLRAYPETRRAERGLIGPGSPVVSGRTVNFARDGVARLSKWAIRVQVGSHRASGLSACWTL
ncbi:hypothetical protein CHELA17_64291 [Chelatococcus asaccharovorans]|nr:hypothetical protein CHELA17_64291 [Chelatococcus asaccharovorans]